MLRYFFKLRRTNWLTAKNWYNVIFIAEYIAVSGYQMKLYGIFPPCFAPFWDVWHLDQMAIGKRPPRNYVRLRGSRFDHLRSNSTPGIHHVFLFSRRKWRFVPKNHQNQQKWHFEIRFASMFSSKVTKKWQNNMIFVFYVFFMINVASLYS